MNYLLKQLKREYPWLKDADSTALTGTTENLHKAYTRFFKGQTRFPKFKSKKHEQSYISKCVNNNIVIITSAFQSWVPYTSNVIADLKAKGMMHNHHLSRAVANVTGTCLQTCLPTNACLMARNWFVLIRNTQARHAMYVAASTIAWVITHMDGWRSENGTVLSVALTLIETLTLQSISKKQVWL